MHKHFALVIFFVSAFSTGAQAHPGHNEPIHALDDATLAAHTGRFIPSEGHRLLIGLDRVVGVNGVLQWADRWQWAVCASTCSTPVVPDQAPTALTLQNPLDAITLQQWQVLTVQLPDITAQTWMDTRALDSMWLQQLRQ